MSRKHCPKCGSIDWRGCNKIVFDPIRCWKYEWFLKCDDCGHTSEKFDTQTEMNEYYAEMPVFDL